MQSVESHLMFQMNMSQETYLLPAIYLILPVALGPGVYSASNRNEYWKQKNNVFGEKSAAGA
jgi:hypothetical protein